MNERSTYAGNVTTRQLQRASLKAIRKLAVLRLFILKASRKLAVLQNVRFLKRNTLDLLYEVTVRSEIDYALPISKCLVIN
jgi:hypothetical protein